MTQIRQIEFVNAKGNTVRIILESETGDLSNQKFEVTGIRFRWELSEFGFGGLNQIVTLDIFDDGIVFDLLAAGRRQDVRIRIFINDKEIFRGFPDYDQLRRFPKRQEKREFQAVFYNPIAFKKEMVWQDQLNRTGAGFETEVFLTVPSGTVRFAAIFDSLFDEYNKRLLTSHNWEQEQSSFQGSNAYNLFNQTYISQTFANDFGFLRQGFTDVINRLSRSFWFRYGYSYKHQQPLVIQVNAGFDGEYTLTELGGLVFIGTTDEPFTTPKDVYINETILQVPNFTVESLDDFKLNFLNEDTTQRDVESYVAITYGRGGEDYANRLAEFTQANPDDTLLTDSFFYSDVAVDINEEVGAPQFHYMFTLDEDSGSIKLPSPKGFKDTEIEDKFMDLTEIMAKSHMTLRSETNKNRSFVYKEILDPMIPYIWDNRIWHLWRGEYDLFSEETIVKDSIGYFYIDYY